MTVRYHDGPGSGRATHSYTCSFFKTNYGTGDSCQRRSYIGRWKGANDLETRVFSPQSRPHTPIEFPLYLSQGVRARSGSFA